MLAQASALSSEPGIQKPDADAFERGGVPCDERQVVLERGCGHEAVDRRKRTLRAQLAPALGDRRRDWQHPVLVLRFQRRQPALVHVCLRAVAATSQALDALPDLTNDEDAQRE